MAKREITPAEVEPVDPGQVRRFGDVGDEALDFITIRDENGKIINPSGGSGNVPLAPEIASNNDNA